MWEYDAARILADGDVLGTLNAAIADEEAATGDSATRRLLGGITYDDAGAVAGARALALRTAASLGGSVGDVFDRSEAANATAVSRVELVRRWELAVVEATQAYTSASPDFDIYAESFFFLDREVNAAISADMWYARREESERGVGRHATRDLRWPPLTRVASPAAARGRRPVVGMLLLVCYGALVMSRGNLVDSQAALALWSIASILLAVASSYGLCAWFRVPYSYAESRPAAAVAPRAHRGRPAALRRPAFGR